MNIGLIITIIVFIGGILGSFVYLVVMSKNKATDASAESNGILRGLVDDQKTEIGNLRARMHDMVNEMTALKLQVQILTDRRDYLETLVVVALGKEFSADPSLAKTVKTLVQEAKVANARP